MIAALADLPNDVGALKALVLHWAEQAAAKAAELARAQDANTTLWETLRQLRRAQFGRKSEKLDPDQLNLAMEETEQKREPQMRPRLRRWKRRLRSPALSIAARCPLISREKRSSSNRKVPLVLAVTAPCMSWARTAPSGWT